MSTNRLGFRRQFQVPCLLDAVLYKQPIYIRDLIGRLLLRHGDSSVNGSFACWEILAVGGF